MQGAARIGDNRPHEVRALTGAEIRREFPRTPEVRAGIFIPLRDGTRLAARVWLPDDAETAPVPAVLEYLPYRLNDGTAAGDHQQMTYFAGHGYAAVRVDIRGTGESEGVCTDEYTPQEQADCLEVIEWIAAQPWCTGAVGMMGYSWSGFNCLQAAALRPPGAARDRELLCVRRPLRRRCALPRRPRHAHGHGALVDLHAGLAGPAARPRGGRRRLARDVGAAA